MNLINFLCCRKSNAAVVFVSPMEKRMGSRAELVLRSSNSLDLECELFREYKDRAGRSELRLRNDQPRGSRDRSLSSSIGSSSSGR
mmetsp:Transcript_10323/g.17022  ORF Transcript_10323/g.17022 Transcript_10323/m.17022 type:complete len:86 (-) Transcript_10323:225-482(-)